MLPVYVAAPMSEVSGPSESTFWLHLEAASEVGRTEDQLCL